MSSNITTTTTQSAWACLRQAHKGLSHSDIAGTREESPHPLPSHGTSIWLGSNMNKIGMRLFSGFSGPVWAMVQERLCLSLCHIFFFVFNLFFEFLCSFVYFECWIGYVRSICLIWSN